MTITVDIHEANGGRECSNVQFTLKGTNIFQANDPCKRSMNLSIKAMLMPQMMVIKVKVMAMMVTMTTTTMTAS